MGKMRDITDSELKIASIDAVRQSKMQRGHIDSPPTGRHSDCFAYVLSGEVSYIFEGNIHLSPKPGDVLYLPYNSTYCFDIISPFYEVYYTDFNFSDNNICLNKPAVFHVSNALNIKNTFEKLYKKWIIKQSGYYLECFSLLYEIYGKIFKSDHSYIPSSIYNALSKSMNYIISNYTNSTLSIKDIVNQTPFCEGHFRRIFKQAYHASPIEYIINLRINYAKDLLLDTNLNLNDIADISGFANLPYFCRQFKKRTGYAPAEYRKIHRAI